MKLVMQRAEKRLFDGWIYAPEDYKAGSDGLYATVWYYALAADAGEWCASWGYRGVHELERSTRAEVLAALNEATGREYVIDDAAPQGTLL